MYDHGMTFCYHEALKGSGQIEKRNKTFYKSRCLIKNTEMKGFINNNSRYKLIYWFAILYIHGKKFILGSVFTYKRLSSKDFIFC